MCDTQRGALLMTINYKPVNSVALLVSLYNIQKIYVILVNHCITDQWSKANTFVTVIPWEFRTNTSYLFQCVCKENFLSTLLTWFCLSESIICQTKYSITQLFRFLSRSTPCACIFLMSIKVLWISLPSGWWYSNLPYLHYLWWHIQFSAAWYHSNT